MDDSTAKQFEQQCKMTKLDLALASVIPSVKIKKLYHTPNADEPFHVISADLGVEPSQDTHDDISPNVKQFFKDPLSQIGHSQVDDEPKHTQTKLGHSMRASVGHSTRRQQMTQLDVMKDRQSLLDKMREQRETYCKREIAKEDATILVNQLLLHGYQISPPTESHQGVGCMTPMTTASVDFNPSSNNQEAEIVRSIHKEIERVHAFNSSSQ